MRFGSRRTLLGLVATMTAATAMSACSPPANTQNTGSATGSAGSSDGKTITAWLQQKPDSMSPLTGGTYGNNSVLMVTQDKLANVSSDGKVENRLMSEWSMSPDAKRLTLKLVEQQWSDGTPFTADDVVFTFNIHADPATKSPAGSLFRSVAGYDAVASGSAKELSGVKKVDDRTVEVTFSKAESGFPYTIFGGDLYILSKKALEGQDRATLATSAIWTKPGGVPGLGPFVMSNNVEGQRIEFTRNDKFRTPAKFEKLVESFVTQDVATQQLSSGEIDLTLVSPTDVKTVEGLSGVTLVRAESAGFDRYSVAQTKPYLKNPKVRQGLLTAIDREGIISSVYAGLAKPINTSFTSPKINSAGLKTYAHDAAAAKKLLQDGGWDFSRELQIWQASGNPQREAINQVVLKNLTDAGVKATIRPVDQTQVTDMLTKTSYDLFLFGGGNYVADPATNIPMLSCATAFPKGANLPGYCNEKVDALFDQSQQTSDEAARTALFQQAATLENADVSYLWIARPERVFAHSAKLTGGVKAGDGMPNALAYVADWTTQ